MGFVGGSSFGGRPVGRSGTAEKCRRGVSIHVARSRWQMGLFDSLKKAVSGISEPSADGNEGTQGSDSNNDEENKRILERYGERVKKINAMEAEIEVLNDDELKQRSLALRDAVRKKEKTLDEVLEEAFTLVREAAFRCLGLRHYDVQLMGGMALNEGRIAEMATGEGKTLVCTLPAYLNALSGESVFVVTVNDYLAKRDADLMGRVGCELSCCIHFATPDAIRPSPDSVLAPFLLHLKFHPSSSPVAFRYIASSAYRSDSSRLE